MVVAKSSGEKRRLPEGGSLGSGDLLYRAAVDHPVCDSVVSEALEPYSGRLITTERHRAGRASGAAKALCTELSLAWA